MRTTLDLDDQLLRQAKAKAAADGRTLTDLIEDALRREVMLQAVTKRQKPLRLRTVNGKGLQPGVDLTDSAALLDLIEQPRK